MERFAKDRQVFFFEEFIPTDHHLAYLEIHPFDGTAVKAVRPRVPHGWSEGDRAGAENCWMISSGFAARHAQFCGFTLR